MDIENVSDNYDEDEEDAFTPSEYSLVFYKGKLCKVFFDSITACDWVENQENENFYDVKEDLSISELENHGFNDGKNSCTYDEIQTFVFNDYDNDNNDYDDDDDYDYDDDDDDDDDDDNDDDDD